jgi:uncharacterized protein (TIGR03086 family)
MIDLDRRAVTATRELVAAWPGADVRLPTPCDGWTIADLVAHMTVQQRGFARAVAGERTTRADWEPTAADATAAAYDAACQQVIDAFAAVRDPDAPVLLPEFGDTLLPAGMVVGFHLVDNVVHAWDVAKSLGAEVSFDDDVLAAALGVARSVPDDERRGGPGSPFARRKPVEPGTGLLDETLLLLGRDPGWRP